jgi:hypothetical protein
LICSIEFVFTGIEWKNLKEINEMVKADRQV